MGWVIAQSLEGSRFGMYLATLANFVSSLVVPKRAKTSDSRERPIGSLLYGPGVNELEAMGECIALGYSREPPVATFSGRTERQSGSPPGVGYQYVRPAFTNFENEDDDEDDFRDLRDLDLPSLIDRIRDGLDHFHVLQAFTETGLG
jgi:hypothetical protein